MGVAQVDLEGVWGFETEYRCVAELQKLDPEVQALRQLMGGRTRLSYRKLDEPLHVALAKYLARDPKSENLSL